MTPAITAPDVPFEQPWQVRAFAMAVAVVEQQGKTWEDFRVELKAAVAQDPARDYYESVLVAVERLL